MEKTGGDSTQVGEMCDQSTVKGRLWPVFFWLERLDGSCTSNHVLRKISIEGPCKISRALLVCAVAAARPTPGPSKRSLPTRAGGRSYVFFFFLFFFSFSFSFLFYFFSPIPCPATCMLVSLLFLFFPYSSFLFSFSFSIFIFFFSYLISFIFLFFSVS